VELFAAAPNSADRNPDMSSGILTPPGLRIWTIWENNNTGFWKLYGATAVVEFGSVGGEGSPPPAIRLDQNYPNPFNPGTTISFTIPGEIPVLGGLPRQTHVTLRVYDILGREVATIVDEERYPGIYKETWHPENRPGGVYFYRVTAGSNSVTRKMVLLR
jgi:hypothetical protein